MPDENRSPGPPLVRAGGWRANIRALAPGLQRSTTTAPAADPDSSIFRNPLRSTSEQRSLFGEILDWMLAPLLLLWPMSITITYLVAQNIANAPFDRNLADSVDVLADHVKIVRGVAQLQLPLPAREMLRADSADNVYFMVLGLRGEFVAGDPDLALPPEDEAPVGGPVRYRTDQMRGQPVRIAYTWIDYGNLRGPQPVLVQVAETLEKRTQLANEIIKGVIVPQFVVLPVAVILVWFGLSRGLAPLNALQARIRARRPDDLSPIDRRAAPEEMAPLVDAFNELLSRLEQNLATQRRFMGDAAHQMKTPLAGLRMQAELALRETDPEQLRRSLKQIASSTHRATHLINQLLALARAEHQATDLAAFARVDLASLAREQVRDRVPLAMARGIDLGYEGAEDRVEVIGLPVLLGEMINNLLDNALNYTPASATPMNSVTVRVRREGSLAILEVEDTGPGIPPHERELVFERFYRVLGTNVDGSGLGLAIVREIVEQHDARVSIGENPRAGGSAAPGTLIRVEFRLAAASARERGTRQ